MNPDDISHLVLAAGALGLAAYGLVDALKYFNNVALSGYKRLEELLGPLYAALKVPYGKDYEHVLQSHYRTARTTGDLPRALRQGARLALVPSLAEDLAKAVGVVESGRIVAVSDKLAAGKELNEADRAVLGRYELAVDARIDAALQSADSDYTNRTRIIAAFVALGISLLVGFSASEYDASTFLNDYLVKAIIVGLAAIPLAPIAKDLANAINSAQKALRK